MKPNYYVPRGLRKVLVRGLRRKGINAESLARPPGPQIIEPSEHTRRGGPSRLAAQIRRNAHRFTHLRRIVVSQHAPSWCRRAVVCDPVRKGLQSILFYDTKPFTDLWYKTATKGHKAKIYVR